MSFLSYRFLFFVLLLLLLYYTLLRRRQWQLLLVASALFYLASGPGNLLFIAVTTISTYLSARRIGRLHDLGNATKAQNTVSAVTQAVGVAQAAGATQAAGVARITLWLCLLVNFGMLAVCKVRVARGDMLLPLGISFYMFSSMGYLMDVHRGSVKPEKSFFKTALFVSFFPQLIQGPIGRFDRLSAMYFTQHPYDARAVVFGLQRMLWGYFKKLVIADRIAVAVVSLLAPEHTGLSFLTLTCFYAVQLYADFTGGIDIALGVAEALGITLPENFARPFFSKNIAEYWRRWHMTLGEWMKDYIFYPVSVSAPMRRFGKYARRRFKKAGRRLPVYAATLITWFCTGIWHGITPNFLLWGMLNAGFIILSEELTPLYKRFHARFGLKDKKLYGCFEMLRMFFLMNLIRITDLFPSLPEYFRRLLTIFSSFRVPFGALGLSAADYIVLALGCLLLILVSLCRERGIRLRAALWKRKSLGTLLTFALLMLTIVLGRYGIGYDAASFIYNRF